ncbi:hypothetical protein HD554DRAFT_2177608 [Boletus coccyginus]|nr:hypothetical protein HD554DRAFT_2177608 [Boletus coccyginus]
MSWFQYVSRADLGLSRSGYARVQSPMLSLELNAAILFLMIMRFSSPLIEATVIGIILAAVHCGLISAAHLRDFVPLSDIASFQMSENNMHPTTL